MRYHLKKPGSTPDLITSTYFFFLDGWPSRWEDYASIQAKQGLPNHKFLKHCPTRWLILESACKRVIEQWPALIIYFLKHVPSKHSALVTNYHCKNITTLLIKKPTLKAEVYFVINSASIFTKFTGFFQKNKQLIHVLYSELNMLVTTLIGRFCRQTYLKSNNFKNLIDTHTHTHLIMCLLNK